VGPSMLSRPNTNSSDPDWPSKAVKTWHPARSHPPILDLAYFSPSPHVSASLSLTIWLQSATDEGRKARKFHGCRYQFELRAIECEDAKWV
jgi:hypothetical protein